MMRNGLLDGESGLMVLGWLLVVAAVAGVAALAVVLVSGVVASSSQDVASHNARQVSAEVAVSEVERRWRAESPASTSEAERLNRDYATRCRRLGILYPDISLMPWSKPGVLAKSAEGWNVDLLPVCTLV